MCNNGQQSNCYHFDTRNNILFIDTWWRESTLEPMTRRKHDIFPESAVLLHIDTYPMFRADSRFWLVDSDRRPLSLPLRYDLVTLCLNDDFGPD